MIVECPMDPYILFTYQFHFQGVFAPRSELEGTKAFSCVARQAVRRLVSLGFNLDNLKNSFRADPSYEIPANVFLQDMTQVKFISDILYDYMKLLNFTIQIIRFIFRSKDLEYTPKQIMLGSSSKNTSVRVILSFEEFTITPSY